MKKAMAFFLLAVLIMGAKKSDATPQPVKADAYNYEEATADDMDVAADDTAYKPAAQATSKAVSAPATAQDAAAKATGIGAAVKVMANPAVQKLMSGTPEEVNARLESFRRVTEAMAKTARPEAQTTNTTTNKKK